MESGQFGGPHFQAIKVLLAQNNFISFIPKISINLGNTTIHQTLLVTTSEDATILFTTLHLNTLD